LKVVGTDTDFHPVRMASKDIGEMAEKITWTLVRRDDMRIGDGVDGVESVRDASNPWGLASKVPSQSDDFTWGVLVVVANGRPGRVVVQEDDAVLLGSLNTINEIG
jgi:hypothetical protein